MNRFSEMTGIRSSRRVWEGGSGARIRCARYPSHVRGHVHHDGRKMQQRPRETSLSIPAALMLSSTDGLSQKCAVGRKNLSLKLTGHDGSLLSLY